VDKKRHSEGWYSKLREDLKYRKNVAGVIVNQEGLILTCKRFDEYADWQLPQGGVDAGENEDEAILRELHEEILLTNAQIIAKTPEYYKYEWPDDLLHRGHRGQEQKLFLLSPPANFMPDLVSAPTKEFKEFQWVSLQEFTQLTKETFRFQSYSKGLEYFKLNHLNFFRES